MLVIVLALFKFCLSLQNSTGILHVGYTTFSDLNLYDRKFFDVPCVHNVVYLHTHIGHNVTKVNSTFHYSSIENGDIFSLYISQDVNEIGVDFQSDSSNETIWKFLKVLTTNTSDEHNTFLELKNGNQKRYHDYKLTIPTQACKLRRGQTLKFLIEREFCNPNSHCSFYIVTTQYLFPTFWLIFGILMGSIVIFAIIGISLGLCKLILFRKRLNEYGVPKTHMRNLEDDPINY